MRIRNLCVRHFRGRWQCKTSKMIHKQRNSDIENKKKRECVRVPAFVSVCVSFISLRCKKKNNDYSVCNICMASDALTFMWMSLEFFKFIFFFILFCTCTTLSSSYVQFSLMCDSHLQFIWFIERFLAAVVGRSPHFHVHTMNSHRYSNHFIYFFSLILLLLRFKLCRRCRRWCLVFCTFIFWVWRWRWMRTLTRTPKSHSSCFLRLFFFSLFFLNARRTKRMAIRRMCRRVCLHDEKRIKRRYSSSYFFFSMFVDGWVSIEYIMQIQHLF